MKFLKQVANYYIDKSKSGLNLSDYTFVFPNRRSAMFMRKYLKGSFSATGFMPKLITITTFTQNFCKYPLAKDEELVFILYQAYKEVLTKKKRKEQIREFDDFIFWGNILLNDFNDIDAYLINYEELFKDIKNYQLESNYLTQEQIEVAEILGIRRNLKVDMENFWKNTVSYKGKEPIDKFISIWEILLDLYLAFRKRLEKFNLSYSGMQSKEAALRIKEMDIKDFRNRRYAFVGFNVLSTARIQIFKRMQTLGIAEFFWDIASPILSEYGNKAGSFITPLAKAFKSPEDFNLQKITHIPTIDVYPVESNIAQTKIATQILQDWAVEDAKRKAEKEKYDKNTGLAIPFTSIGSEASALILPDEKLLMPMLFSLPTKLAGDSNNPESDNDNLKINVAMRMTYSDTPFASLISSILYLQEHAREIKKVYHYFYKDVIEIVSHPYIATFATSDANKIKEFIIKAHIYNASSEELVQIAPSLAFIFKAINDLKNLNEVKTYLDNLIDNLRDLLPEKKTHESGNDDSKKKKKIEPYETKILNSLQNSIDEMFVLSNSYSIEMGAHTFFSMVRKMLKSLSMHFNGSPVEGLQILSMPDARCLDFDNLIILSMNERLLPMHNYSPSFIPPLMRYGSGMPIDENEEISVAYQFYRLISRAKRVSFIYDSRTPDLSSGEKSRFITQLELLYPDKINVKKVNMGVKTANKRKISIKKTESVLNDLKRFKEGGDLNISASALKTYITCPLKFYLQNVKGLRMEDFDPEYIDAASYGSVLHRVAEMFYKDFRPTPGAKVLITQRELRSYFSSKANIARLEMKLQDYALKAMNELYYNNSYTDNLASIPGEGRVLAKVIAQYVRVMLECESNYDDFIFIEGEDQLGQKTHVWNLDNNLSFNFTMSIDRVDQLDDKGMSLRFIDYKTGGDDTSAPSVEELFTNHKYGAIFQLMTYCLAYNDLKHVDTCIKPVIYKFTDMAKEGIKDIKIEKKAVDDFRQLEGQNAYELRDKFRQGLISLMSSIFSPETSFEQTEETDNCKYCQFVNLCGRTVS